MNYMQTSLLTALEVYLYTTMRYINRRFTYLLTLTATACRKSIWRHRRSTKQNALWLATTRLC